MAKWLDDQTLEREDASSELEIAFLNFFVYIRQKLLHLISKKTPEILRYRWHFVFTGWLTGGFD